MNRPSHSGLTTSGVATQHPSRRPRIRGLNVRVSAPYGHLAARATPEGVRLSCMHDKAGCRAKTSLAGWLGQQDHYVLIKSELRKLY